MRTFEDLTASERASLDSIASSFKPCTPDCVHRTENPGGIKECVFWCDRHRCYSNVVVCLDDSDAWMKAYNARLDELLAGAEQTRLEF